MMCAVCCVLCVVCRELYGVWYCMLIQIFPSFYLPSSFLRYLPKTTETGPLVSVARLLGKIGKLELFKVNLPALTRRNLVIESNALGMNIATHYKVRKQPINIYIQV